MKAIACVLIFVLLFSAAGCSPLRHINEVIDESVAGTVMEEDIFETTQADVLTYKWPSDMLPDVVPEYTAGHLVGYSGLQSSLSITVTDTSVEDVNDYRQALRDSAFALDKNLVATKDDIEIAVDYLEASQTAVISVTYTDMEQWPAEMMMDIPPLEYGVITYLDTSDADNIFMQLCYLSTEHARLWFEQLEAEGFVKNSHGYTRNDADIVLTDYNHGEWDIEIKLRRG